jgi:hypothetical protein
MNDNLPFEIAAAIFAHQLMGMNTANERLVDTKVTMDWIDEKVGLLKGREAVEQHVEDLVEAGTLSKRDTSSYGYGDHYEPGPIVYSITERGILELFFYSPVSGSLRERSYPALIEQPDGTIE